MSDKPFDLEAARRGEMVQYNCGGTVVTTEWMDVHFVGVCKDGNVAVHAIQGGTIFCPPVSRLRMTPKPPKEMWVQLYVSPGGGLVSCTNPRHSPDEARNAVNFCDLLGEPQKVLVPEDA